MAITVITAPLGTITSNKFTLFIAQQAFDPLFAKNVNLIGANLTVINGSGAGQGACVYPEFAQSSGVYYIEYTWNALTSALLQLGGPGFCTVPAIGDYASLADHGQDGIVFRPNGTLVENVPNGNGVHPGDGVWPLWWLSKVTDGVPGPFPCQQGDTLGLLIDFDSNPDWVLIQFWAAGGSIASPVQYEAGTFFLPRDAYVPCVVFDAAPVDDELVITANFGASEFLGPNVWDDGRFEGVTLGWPNKA